jgi:hypothetical protein
MSKGGAGKVYFVLYLAVILELLIIFIERDEAEESLNREREQAIQIVQTILSQLQTGSGAQGITAKPKDAIVINDEDPMANIRNYDVIVSVGDPRAASMVDGKQIRGDDVSRLNYIVSHNSNAGILPEELGPDTADITGGQKIFEAMLGTEVGDYTTPKQVFGASIPAEDPSKYFFLNQQLTEEAVAQGRRVKVFSVNFKPNQGEGWYRLRFDSKTNKILGIMGGKPSDVDTVRIGNVKLTVGQLKQVRKALAKSKGSGEESSRVLQYIDKLLTPGSEFAENMGLMSFDVRVTVPPAPKPQDPVAEIIARDTTYWYNIAPFTVQVKLGPKEGSHDVSGGARLSELDAARNLYQATYDNLQPGVMPITAKASNAGKVETSEKYVVVDQPAMRGGIDRWKGLKATVSRKYNPTSDWESTQIPDNHYQTEVEIDGKQAFSRPGVNFKESELPNELMIGENTKEVKTTVYWKPNGTADRTLWVPLAANYAVTGVAVPLGKKPFEISYPVPEQVEGFEFDWVLSAKSLKKDFGPIVMQQKIGEGRFVAVQAQVSCQECAELGIDAQLIQSDDTKWTLALRADPAKLKPTINGKKLDIGINMTGRGGASGFGVVSVNIKVGR